MALSPGLLIGVGGSWLYFCTVNLDTGETKFAATADEHDQNVAELRKWQAENQ